MFKFRGKVTRKMPLNYLASFKKLLENFLEDKPEMTVPDIINSIDYILRCEGFEEPVEIGVTESGEGANYDNTDFT